MPDARQTVDRWFSIRLGVSVGDLKPGEVAVATCERDTLWVVDFGDRAVVQTRRAALEVMSRLASASRPDHVTRDEFCGDLVAGLRACHPAVTWEVWGTKVYFYHPGHAALVATDGEIRRLTPADVGKWVGHRLGASGADQPGVVPGEAWGLFLGDRLIGEVVTHHTSGADMAHLVVEDGIEVTEEYRGRGYGKALLAAWTRKMQVRGRVCIHSTAADNAASLAVARAVGYVEYARRRRITCPPAKD